MKRYLIMIATAAMLAAGLQLPASANKRPYPVELLSKKDFRQIPDGAAIWFYKKDKYWFHVVIDGHGYMKIDGNLYKFRRIQPTGNRWGCEPMLFDSVGNSVRITKTTGGWTVKLMFGTQSTVIKGLTCNTGD